MIGDSDEATIAKQQNSAARAPFLPICRCSFCFVLFVLTLVPAAAAVHYYQCPKRRQAVLASLSCYFSLTLNPPASQ
jgi:hypothetical protein